MSGPHDIQRGDSPAKDMECKDGDPRKWRPVRHPSSRVEAAVCESCGMKAGSRHRMASDGFIYWLCSGCADKKDWTELYAGFGPSIAALCAPLQARTTKAYSDWMDAGFPRPKPPKYRVWLRYLVISAVIHAVVAAIILLWG